MTAKTARKLLRRLEPTIIKHKTGIQVASPATLKLWKKCTQEACR